MKHQRMSFVYLGFLFFIQRLVSSRRQGISFVLLLLLLFYNNYLSFYWFLCHWLALISVLRWRMSQHFLFKSQSLSSWPKMITSCLHRRRRTFKLLNQNSIIIQFWQLLEIPGTNYFFLIGDAFAFYLC